MLHTAVYASLFTLSSVSPQTVSKIPVFHVIAATRASSLSSGSNGIPSREAWGVCWIGVLQFDSKTAVSVDVSLLDTSLAALSNNPFPDAYVWKPLGTSSPSSRGIVSSQQLEEKTAPTAGIPRSDRQRQYVRTDYDRVSDASSSPSKISCFQASFWRTGEPVTS